MYRKVGFIKVAWICLHGSKSHGLLVRVARKKKMGFMVERRQITLWVGKEENRLQGFSMHEQRQ